MDSDFGNKALKDREEQVSSRLWDLKSLPGVVGYRFQEHPNVKASDRGLVEVRGSCAVGRKPAMHYTKVGKDEGNTKRKDDEVRDHIRFFWFLRLPAERFLPARDVLMLPFFEMPTTLELSLF